LKNSIAFSAAADFGALSGYQIRDKTAGYTTQQALFWGRACLITEI
jgi:hypothetical protein